MAEVGCPRQRRSGQRRAAEAETERFESIASSMGCALTHVKKYARCAQSAVIPVNGEAERHDGWLPPSVSGGRRQPEAVCGGQAAHGATRLHSARQRDVVRVLSHDWQACRHLLERCVKNQPSLVEKGVVCPCTGVWGVVLSWRQRSPSQVSALTTRVGRGVSGSRVSLCLLSPTVCGVVCVSALPRVSSRRL